MPERRDRSRLSRAPVIPAPVHGPWARDDVVDVQLSRTWSPGKRHVRLVEVDDGHELVTTSVPRILAEADDFFRPFLG